MVAQSFDNIESGRKGEGTVSVAVGITGRYSGFSAAVFSVLAGFVRGLIRMKRFWILGLVCALLAFSKYR